MFKQFSHIILSLLLLISTMGMTVSKHYCGDNLVSVSLYEKTDNCCGEMGCCHTNSLHFQVKEDFSVPVVLTSPLLAEVTILGQDLLSNIDFTLPETDLQNSNVTFSPPPLSVQEALSIRQVYRL